MISWEDTILKIQNEPEFSKLISEAYLSSDIDLNFKNYYCSEEFNQIYNLIKTTFPKKKIKILEIGAGNGILSLSLSKKGFLVDCVEPEKSIITGVGSIGFLKQKYGLENLNIFNTSIEEYQFLDKKYDLIVARQVVHHIHDLNAFFQKIKMMSKANTKVFLLRDHVIDEGRLNEFLENHPLHKFYGGENAYTLEEYIIPITKYFSLEKIIGPFDSIINLAPLSYFFLFENLLKKIGIKYANVKEKKANLLQRFLVKLVYKNFAPQQQGRLYSFILKSK